MRFLFVSPIWATKAGGPFELRSSKDGFGGKVPNQTKKDLSGKESIIVFCIWKGRDSGDGTQVLMYANKFFVPIPSYGLLNRWF